jgi:hypothetical protein
MDIAVRAGNKGPFLDDAPYPLNGDNWGAMLVAEQGPQYLEWLRRGWIFSVKTATAAAIPIYSTATNAPTLWNPLSSGKLVVPLFINFTQAAVASAAVTGFMVMVEDGMGDFQQTGAPFPTFTNIAPVSCLVGSKLVATTRYAHGTVTWTTQPTALFDLGIGQNVQGTAATGAPVGGLSYELKGKVGLLPGGAMAVGGYAASGNTWTVSIVFAELPMPKPSLP